MKVEKVNDHFYDLGHCPLRTEPASAAEQAREASFEVWAEEVNVNVNVNGITVVTNGARDLV